MFDHRDDTIKTAKQIPLKKPHKVTNKLSVYLKEICSKCIHIIKNKHVCPKESV